ncbi:LacI family DNA-binding transcriptional regulator [Amaricoccus macauensis]|uniref:LacI family DNA-binding transcriptional regulator n=1 Tax=Amaricoccus macauensis TaxID=57001 RepID=UPI003C7CB0A2
MSNKTTLQQIAEAAQVSLSTVDRVINRRGGVSPKSEARVLEWATRLNLDRKVFRAHLQVLRIAVLMQSPENPFYRALREAFSSADATTQDLRMNLHMFHVDPGDLDDTIRKIETAASGYDGLIIDCVDHVSVTEKLRQVSKRRPVVTFLTDLPSSGRIAYVGPDNRQMGRVAGELMGRFLGERGGKVLVMLGSQQFAGHLDREIGFRAVLRERFPACEIVEILESAESAERAGDLIYRTLKQQPDIRGIYNVTAGNFAIAQCIKALGLQEKVTFITHELTPLRRQLLRTGVLDAVIDQNPRLEAIRAIEVLARHFKRSEHDAPMADFTPFDIYLRENCPPG